MLANIDLSVWIIRGLEWIIVVCLILFLLCYFIVNTLVRTQRLVRSFTLMMAVIWDCQMYCIFRKSWHFFRKVPTDTWPVWCLSIHMPSILLRRQWFEGYDMYNHYETTWKRARTSLWTVSSNKRDASEKIVNCSFLCCYEKQSLDTTQVCGDVYSFNLSELWTNRSFI